MPNYDDRVRLRVDADLAIQNQLRTAERRVGASSRKMAGSLDRVDQSTRRLNLAFRALPLSIGTFALATTFGVGKALRFASAIEEQASKAAVVFGENLGKVRTELAEFGDEVGRSRFALLNIAATFQDTFVPLGFARDRAAELSTRLTILTTDLASFYNAADDDVARSIASALVGNTENLRRFGVNVSQADVKARAYALGLVGLNGELDKQAKTIATLALLEDGVADAQGDAARTAGTYANQTKRLNAEFGDYINSLTSGKLGVAADGVRLLGDAFDYLEKRQTAANRLRTAATGLGAADPQERNLQLAALDRAEADLRGDNGFIAQGLAANGQAGEVVRSARELDPGISNAQAFANRRASIRATGVFLDDSALRLDDTGGQNTGYQGQPTNSFLANRGRRGSERSVQKRFEEETRLAAEALKEQERALEDARRAAAEFDAKIDALAGTISSRLVSAAREGELSLNTLADIGRDVVAQLIQEFLKLQVIKPLLGGLFGGGSGNGFFGGSLPIPGFAGGGSVNAGRPIAVGERGPELFVPHSAGRILPNSQASGGGMQVIVNLTNQFDTGAQAAARLDLERAAPAIRESAIAGVFQAIQEGGSESRIARGVR